MVAKSHALAATPASAPVRDAWPARDLPGTVPERDQAPRGMPESERGRPTSFVAGLATGGTNIPTPFYPALPPLRRRLRQRHCVPPRPGNEADPGQTLGCRLNAADQFAVQLQLAACVGFGPVCFATCGQTQIGHCRAIIGLVEQHRLELEREAETSARRRERQPQHPVEAPRRRSLCQLVKAQPVVQIPEHRQREVRMRDILLAFVASQKIAARLER